MTPDALEQRRIDLERALGERVTLDGPAPHFRIFQRKKGYRYSVDDLLTAHFVTTSLTKNPENILDLGIGIGCVGLGLAALYQLANVTGIEAQDISVKMLTQNIWANQFESRVRVIHDDLRNHAQHSLANNFDLVSASPPYFHKNKGILPQDSQAAHCRFELRGDIVDYAQCAAAHLGPEGHFVFCFSTAEIERAFDAVSAVGLHVRRVQRVIPKTNSTSLFSLLDCTWQAGERVEVHPLTVRDAMGETTQEMNAVHLIFQR